MESAYEIQEIMQLLPHRYPFLLIDRVIELVPDDRIVALKNVTINEPFFQGHFPGKPIMPGVLIIEAMHSCLSDQPGGKTQSTYILYGHG